MSKGLITDYIRLTGEDKPLTISKPTGRTNSVVVYYDGMNERLNITLLDSDGEPIGNTILGKQAIRNLSEWFKENAG